MLGLENTHGSGSDVHNCQRALARETGHEAIVAFFFLLGRKNSNYYKACFYGNCSSRIFCVGFESQDSPSYEVFLFCLHGCVTTTLVFLISETDGKKSAPDPCQSQERSLSTSAPGKTCGRSMCENTFCCEG